MLRATSCILAAIAAVTSVADVRTEVGDFTLLDHRGKSHQLSYYGDHKAVVLLIHATASSTFQNAAASLSDIRARFTEDVVFFMLNAKPTDDRAGIAADAEAQGYELPILVDDAQLVAESLNARRVGEALVVAPRSRTRAYRGPVDAGDTRHMVRAIAALLSAEGAASAPIDVALRAGDPIGYASRDAHRAEPVSYSEDIAPILERNCVGCHHDGAIAPW